MTATLSDPEKRLARFIARFEPRHQRLIRAARRTLRRRLATAYELAYDNYNFFVIGYSPTERPSDAAMSIVAGANGVSLCFLQGARLPDPHKILLGSGKQTRFVRVESARQLTCPEVEALIAAAIAGAKVALSGGRRGPLIIRSVSSKLRPRRRVVKKAR
jgi:hypothetical protein